MGELIDRFDTGLDQIALGAAADLCDKYGVAIIDRTDDRLKTVFLAITALAIEIDTAVPDELRARCGKLPNLEFLGMAKVLVDEAEPLVATATSSLISLCSPARVASSSCFAATFAMRSSSTFS